MSRDIKAGGAYVELLLKKKKFLGGLKAAGAALAKFSKGAILAAAVAAAVGVRNFLKLGDQLDKMSKRTGISVQALSELKHAAELSGTSLEAVEKGVRKMQKGFIDAELGLSTAVDNLDMLNLSISDFEGLNPEEQFNLFAERISEVEDPSRRAALAMNTFGKAGAALIPMLSDGPEGLNAMREEAERLGLTMDGDTAAAAARLNDMFSTLWSTIKMLSVGIGSALAPVLEFIVPLFQSVANGVVGALKAMTSQGQALWAEFGGVVTFYAKFVWDVVSAMATNVSQIFVTLWKSTVDIVTGAWSAIGESTGITLRWLQDAVIGTLSVITFAFADWRRLLEMAVTSAMLSVVRFANQTVHLFGTVIPTWLGWFLDNWRDVFTDIANITMTVSSNIWTNLSNLWDSIVGLFSGDGLAFEWTNLTEGFESAIKELPRIAAREIGPIEASLQAELNKLADGMVQDFLDHDVKLHDVVDNFLPAIADFADEAAAAIAKIEAVAPEEGGGGVKAKVLSSFSLAALQASAGQGTRNEIKALRKQQAKEQRDLLKAMKQNGGLNA